MFQFTFVRYMLQYLLINLYIYGFFKSDILFPRIFVQQFLAKINFGRKSIYFAKNTVLLNLELINYR